MHIYIPVWLCWTCGVAAVLVIALAVGITVAMGIAEGNRDIDAILRESYQDPRQARVAQSRQEDL
jgi:hypothetical protein